MRDMIVYIEQAIAADRTVADVIAAGIPERWQDQMTELLTPEFVLRNFYEGVQRHNRPD